MAGALLTPSRFCCTRTQDEQELAELPSEAPSWRQRAKTFALEYGRVGVATHVMLSAMSFSTIYIVVSSGVDVTALLNAVGFSPSTSETATNSAGSFLIAYTIYKVLSPVRWPITFAVTPVVLRALRRRGYMVAPTAPPRSPPPNDH